VLFIVDRESGYVLSSQLIIPHPSIPAMWGRVPMEVVCELQKMGCVPEGMIVRSGGLLYGVLERLGNELGIRLRQSRFLKGLDPAKKALLEWGISGLSSRSQRAGNL